MKRAAPPVVSIAVLSALALLAVAARAEAPTLTPARLAAAAWSNHADLRSREGVARAGGLFVAFREDLTFSAVAGPGQGDALAFDGTYAIDGDRLTLLRAGARGPVAWLSGGRLVLASDGRGYPCWCLVFEQDLAPPGVAVFAPTDVSARALLDLTTTRTPGTSVEIGGVAAIAVDAPGRATATLNTRAAPSAQAERLVFQTAAGPRTAVERDAELTILARTEAAETIGGREGHWLFVEFHPGPEGAVRAWVFGAFVERE